MDKLPHFRARKAAGGLLRYSWEPAPGLLARGWPTVPLGMSDHVTDAQARQLAARINAMVQEWRDGKLDRIPDVILNLKLVATPGKPAGKRLMRAAPARGTCAHLFDAYLASREFRLLAEATRVSYRGNTDFLRRWCGDQPVGAITPRMCKKLYETLYDGVPARGGQEARPGVPRQAQKIIVMGRTIWKWAASEDMATTNPWLAVKTQTPEPDVPELWSDDAIAHFVATADAMGLHSVGTAVLLNSWLGQRVADVRAWDRRFMRDGWLHLTQRKTGARVELPVTMVPELVARLEADEARAHAAGLISTYLIHDANGQPYSDGGLRATFNKVRAAASQQLPTIAKLDLMHLRHTAVTRLGEAGCTPQEIRAISGHSLKSITAMLKRYNIVTRKQAARAFAKRLQVGANREVADDDGDDLDME